MKINNAFKLVIAVVLSELAGIVGSVFTAPYIPTWYAGIIKPDINPPAWVFAPVWTTLFALMGIAAFLVWKHGLKRREVKIALTLFIVQLVLNMLWSVIFFGFHNPGGAFVELIFLWIAILVTIIIFAKISKPAAWLLVPYILWVSFAGYLNYSIWRLNANTVREIPVKLYYYNPALDQGPGGAECSRQGFAAVNRTIPKTGTPIEDTVRLLLRGEITAKEKEDGLSTEFPLPGLTLRSASLKNGELTLTFDDPQNKTGGGSCRVGILWFQIEATALQFPEVKNVRFLPEELFQP